MAVVALGGQVEIFAITTRDVDALGLFDGFGDSLEFFDRSEKATVTVDMDSEQFGI